MEERGQVSRRQILARGGAITVGVAIVGMSGRRAVARPGRSKAEARPCLGEPGYPERVSELFHSRDLPVNPSTY